MFESEHSPRGLLQFDDSDIIWEDNPTVVYEIPELSTNGVLFADIKGYEGRYILGTDGIVRKRLTNKKLQIPQLPMGRNEYVEVKPYPESHVAPDVNPYLKVDLITPKGNKRKEELGTLILLHFKKIPIAIINRSPLLGDAADNIYYIPRKKLKTGYKDANGMVANVDTVYWCFANDLQYESQKNGRNKPPCLRKEMPVVAFYKDSGKVQGYYKSKGQLGRYSKHPNNKAGMVSNETRLRRDGITLSDGTEVYVREADKVDKDVLRIAINLSYQNGLFKDDLF